MDKEISISEEIPETSELEEQLDSIDSANIIHNRELQTARIVNATPQNPQTDQISVKFTIEFTDGSLGYVEFDSISELDIFLSNLGFERGFDDIDTLDRILLEEIPVMYTEKNGLVVLYDKYGSLPKEYYPSKNGWWFSTITSAGSRNLSLSAAVIISLSSLLIGFYTTLALGPSYVPAIENVMVGSILSLIIGTVLFVGLFTYTEYSPRQQQISLSE